MIQINSEDTFLNATIKQSSYVKYVSNTNAYFEVATGDIIKLSLKDYTVSNPVSSNQTISLKCNVVYQH
jgi:hypothetical protein